MSSSGKASWCMRVRMSPGSTSTADTPRSPQLRGQRPGQQLQRRLARAIRSPARIGGLRGVARDVHDETAAFGQQRHGELNQRDRRARVDGEDPSESLHVEVHQRPDAAELRGVVHEHVQAPSSRAVSISRARTDASVTSPATGTTRDLPGRAMASTAVCSGPESARRRRGHSRVRPARRRSPRRARGSRLSRLPPDSTSFMCCPPSPDQHRPSSALEVKEKVWQAGVMADVLTVGEVAARSGVATSALTFLRRAGLDSRGAHRRGPSALPRAVIRRVAFIVFAQQIGLSLEEIRVELAKLPRHRVPERADWAKLSAGWTPRIRARIRELERLEAGLTECIGCGCLSLDRCRLANPGDRAARAGPGPRSWTSSGRQ